MIMQTKATTSVTMSGSWMQARRSVIDTSEHDLRPVCPLVLARGGEDTRFERVERDIGQMNGYVERSEGNKHGWTRMCYLSLKVG